MIKWGIIGCGDVAEVKSGPAFQLVPNSELVAVMRRDAAKAADFARRHKVPFSYSDAAELLANDSINAVYIATPPSSHLYYTEMALEAGKHVYLEKPLAINLEQARSIQALAAKASTKLTVAHYRRQLPAFLKVGQLLAQKAIGEVRFANIEILQSAQAEIVAKTEHNWRLDPSISGGGYFYDLAPHQIDLMLQYFGQAQSYSGVSVNQTGEHSAADMTQGYINFVNGMQFRGVWAFNLDPSAARESCTIYGSEGIVEFTFYGGEVSLRNSEGYQTFSFDTEKHVQQPMIEKTVAYFLGDSEVNPCSVDEAILVAQVMESFSS